MNNLGHNNPPSDSELAYESLSYEFSELMQKSQELVELSSGAPDVCSNDNVANGIVDLIKNINNTMKDIEQARKGKKEPYLNMGRFVDNFFKKPTTALEIAKNTISKPLDKYLLQKAEEERQRRIEKEEELRAIADKKMAEAAKFEAQQNVVEAAVAQQQAMEFDAVANRFGASAESNTGLAKAKTMGGNIASLRSRWIGEIADIEQLDVAALKYYFSEAELLRAVKAFVAAGGRELKGAHIYESSVAVVR